MDGKKLDKKAIKEKKSKIKVLTHELLASDRQAAGYHAQIHRCPSRIQHWW
jgi:hypothetical protein